MNKLREFWENHEHMLKPAAEFVGKVTSELAQFAQLEKVPTAANYLNVAFRVKEHYQANFSENADSYFVSDKWEMVYQPELWPLIVQLLEEFCPKQILPIRIGDSKSITLYSCTLQDPELGQFKIGWREALTIRGMYVTAGNVEKCKAFFNKYVWEWHKSNCIVIDVITKDWWSWFKLNNQPEHNKFVDCQTGRKYVKYLLACQEKHMGRSLLFYGPPGTGKSNIVKNIANNLNLRTLRLQNINRVSNKAILEALQLFDPMALVMEDIDHLYSHDASSLLEKFENFNVSGKIILTTANDISKLNDALLRPGRIDELIEINKLEEESIREITQDEDILKVVRNFPAAFIIEVIKRVDLMGKDEALVHLDDLYKRLKIPVPGKEDKDAKPGEAAKAAEPEGDE